MCLRCNNKESFYCENCMQEVIAENANLQLEIKNIKNVSMKLNKKEQKALEYFGSENLSVPMFHGFILKQLVEKQWMIIDKLEQEKKELEEYKWKYEDLCD